MRNEQLNRLSRTRKEIGIIISEFFFHSSRNIINRQIGYCLNLLQQWKNFRDFRFHSVDVSGKLYDLEYIYRNGFWLSKNLIILSLRRCKYLQIYHWYVCRAILRFFWKPLSGMIHEFAVTFSETMLWIVLTKENFRSINCWVVFPIMKRVGERLCCVLQIRITRWAFSSCTQIFKLFLGWELLLKCKNVEYNNMLEMECSLLLLFLYIGRFNQSHLIYADPKSIMSCKNNDGWVLLVYERFLLFSSIYILIQEIRTHVLLYMRMLCSRKDISSCECLTNVWAKNRFCRLNWILHFMYWLHFSWKVYC